ncbi:hypothetical protein VU07_01485 [Desulfobulbus sp. F4]|nr:hypothetical protein [Desulfobulbus sp. F4]
MMPSFREADSSDSCPGMLVEQVAPCRGSWRNHGKYVAAFAHSVESFLAAGLITAAEKDASFYSGSVNMRPVTAPLMFR